MNERVACFFFMKENIIIMKENSTECNFNEDLERHSTLSLIDCGDACCDIDESDLDLSDFGAWSYCYFPIADRPFLEINTDQRKNGAGTRKTLQSKYCDIPAVYIDRYKCNRTRCIQRPQSQSKEVNRDNNLPSRSTGQCHHQSATGDNKEEIPPENKIKESRDKTLTKRCSREAHDGPICITCYVKSYQMLKYRNYYVSSKEKYIQNYSGDIPSTPNTARQPSRMNKCSLFQSRAKAQSAFWTQFGHRSLRKQQVSSDAMKNISQSAHENNIVWCRKCPGYAEVQHNDIPKVLGGSGREGIDVKKPIPVLKEKGRGSSDQRLQQQPRPVVSPFTNRRSQTPELFWHGYLRSNHTGSGAKFTTLPQSAPPRARLVESSRRTYSNKTTEKSLI